MDTGGLPLVKRGEAGRAGAAMQAMLPAGTQQQEEPMLLDNKHTK